MTSEKTHKISESLALLCGRARTLVDRSQWGAAANGVLTGALARGRSGGNEAPQARQFPLGAAGGDEFGVCSCPEVSAGSGSCGVPGCRCSRAVGKAAGEQRVDEVSEFSGERAILPLRQDFRPLEGPG